MSAPHIAAVAGPLALVAALVMAPFALVAAPQAAPVSAPGVPPRVLVAYLAADAACPGLTWQLLAGVGWVESGHGTTGGATTGPVSGVVRPPIFGPPLDGSNGTERHPIGSWKGRWGLPGPWEQAVGPMQFRPPTFAAWATDGDGSGRVNPHDIDDAVATAAAYLCGPQGEVRDERAAVLRYNRSGAYADKVLGYADQLRQSQPSVATGPWLCPVAGPTTFTDTWGAPRSGGRTHKGVDMFAATGTPVVAPVPGEVEHYNDSLGGLSFRLWGDDGNYYYGTHLSAYGPVTGHVSAGTVVGYVGATGNAAGTGSHLHFEIHPGRQRGDPPSPVNPTPTVAARCSQDGPGVFSGDD